VLELLVNLGKAICDPVQLAPPPGSSKSRSVWLVVATAVVALGAKFFYFISAYSVNIFYYDQWEFLTPFFQGNLDSTELFLRQHGPHRLGLGLIVLKLLYSATHWNTRAEAFLIGGCVFMAMLLTLNLKRRLFCALQYSDVAIPLIFLCLTQFETYIGAPDPAYAGLPLLLISGYCLALLVRNHLLRHTLILLLNFPLIYTGLGFFMGLITIGVFGLELYWRIRGIIDIPLWQSISSVVLAVLSLASFFLHYTFMPAVDCFGTSSHALVNYPWFVALMFSAFLGPRYPLAPVTAAGLISLIVALAIFGLQSFHLVAPPEASRSRNTQPIHLVISVLVGYSLLFSFSASVGRVCLGLPEAAQPSRYSTLLVPAYVGIYFFLLSLPMKALQRIALGMFLILLLPTGLFVPIWAGHKLADGKRAWVACYLRTQSIKYCDQNTGFPVYPRPGQTDLQGKLDFLRRNHLNLFYQ
jgi:hypothetical protein